MTEDTEAKRRSLAHDPEFGGQVDPIVDQEAAYSLADPQGIDAVIAGCAARGVTIDKFAAEDAIERVYGQGEVAAAVLRHPSHGRASRHEMLIVPAVPGLSPLDAGLE